MSAKFLFDTIPLARPSMKLCICKGNKAFLDMQLFFYFFRERGEYNKKGYVKCFRHSLFNFFLIN